jgi:TFIIF-interacting CTD phosphatase-like protein
MRLFLPLTLVDSQNTHLFSNTTRNRSPKQLPSKMPSLAPAVDYTGKKLLALDLDETLVHSSFQVRLSHFFCGIKGSPLPFC